MSEDRPRRRHDLTFEELAEHNELMLVDGEAGRVRVLNATAGGLWLMCDGTRDLDALTEMLCGMLPDVPRGEVRSRVEEAIRFLGDEGLFE